MSDTMSDTNFAQNPDFFPSHSEVNVKLSTHTGIDGTSDVDVPGPYSGHREVGTYHSGQLRSVTSHHGGRRRVKHNMSMRKTHFKRGRQTRSRKSYGGKVKSRKTRGHKAKKRKRHLFRGGEVKGQHFSNTPMSFGYSADLQHLSPHESALANPMPYAAYDASAKVSRT